MQFAAIDNLRMVVGGSAAIDAGLELAGRARTSLSGEFFILNDDAARTALADAWRGREVPGSAVVTAHPQIIDQIAGLTGPRLSVAHYGALAPDTAPREFIHTKSLARDTNSDPEAWLATASFGGNARHEWEVAGMFGGDAARSVHELADAVASRDWQRQRDAISWAQGLGVYVTDPVTRHRGLAEMVESLVRDEPRHLTVAMKSIFDEQFAGELAARHSRDHLPVDVIVERIDEPSERVLREAGITMVKPSETGPALHGNVIIADGLGLGYWGTMWGSPRSFARDGVHNLYTGGGNTLPRSQQWDRSREFGGLTSNAQAVADLRRGFDLLDPRPHDFRGEVVRPT